MSCILVFAGKKLRYRYHTNTHKTTGKQRGWTLLGIQALYCQECSQQADLKVRPKLAEACYRPWVDLGGSGHAYRFTSGQAWSQ